MLANAIGVRWTIGDVSDEGFEALRLSVWGAYRAFGDAASYAICVNTVPIAHAAQKTGALPPGCVWHPAPSEPPSFLRPYLDGGMAEGAAWKLLPLQMFPDRYELSLDNDCVLWSIPDPIRRWVAAGRSSCVLAEDVRACFGVFADRCGAEPRNAGIRGLSPGFDLERAMLDVLSRDGRRLTSELDEQGLQVAALMAAGPVEVVTLADVTICSPFPPHLPHLGRSGAHFCGLNARDLGWRIDGRPASARVREHWCRHRPLLYENVGLPFEDHAIRSSRSAALASPRHLAPVHPNGRRS